MQKLKTHEVDSKLKDRLKKRVKQQKVEVHCPSCGKRAASWTIGSLGSGKLVTCKRKPCKEENGGKSVSVQVDTHAVQKILAEISNM